jgi:hypothetical protein
VLCRYLSQDWKMGEREAWKNLVALLVKVEGGVIFRATMCVCVCVNMG